MKRALATLITPLFLAMPVWADPASGHGGMSHDGMNHAGMDHGAMSSAMSEGMVRKIDKSQGKLTLRHGPLANLDMPAMTMIFRVADPAWLDQVKTGDSIRFQAEKVDGKLTVTQLEIVR